MKMHLLFNKSIMHDIMLQYSMWHAMQQKFSMKSTICIIDAKVCRWMEVTRIPTKRSKKCWEIWFMRCILGPNQRGDNRAKHQIVIYIINCRIPDLHTTYLHSKESWYWIHYHIMWIQITRTNVVLMLTI